MTVELPPDDKLKRSIQEPSVSDLNRGSKEEENLDLNRERQKQDIRLREDYAPRIYSMVKWWLIGVGVLLLLNSLQLSIATPYWFNWNGFRVESIEAFNLHSSVLVALVSGTTVGVIGLLATVIGDLFSKKDRS